MSRYAGIQSSCSEDLEFLDKNRSLSSTFHELETNSSSDAFECNICLDLVQDPVVTFCGHLYCWPCIYRWISSCNENPDPEQAQCPVCKADVSEKTLIPLYGRGKVASENSHISHVIPHRPKCEDAMLMRHVSSDFSRPSYVQPSQPYYSGNNTSPMTFHLGGNATYEIDQTMGMFGEMVYARFFGNSETTSSYHHLGGSSNRRLRRHIMEADTSLSRIFFFLCCSAILCLVLF